MIWCHKPIQVEVVQYQNGILNEAPFWIKSMIKKRILIQRGGVVKFKAQGKEVVLLEGDYIVRDINGNICLYNQVEFEHDFMRVSQKKVKRISDLEEPISVEDVRIFHSHWGNRNWANL